MSEHEVSAQRTRNRWGEGERLRGEILHAASRLLSDLGGSDGLTIRGVARAVGIAPASIYQHFTDRTALIQGLLDYEFDRLHTAMRTADESRDPADVVGRVHAQLHAYCDFALANPGHYRLMLGHGPHRPTDGPPSGPLVDVIGALGAAFDRCTAAGHRLRLPGERAAVLVFVGVHGRVALTHSSGRARTNDLRPFIDDLVSLVFE